MPQSQTIRTSDCQRVVRLIGECRDLGDDPTAWRLHFCAELATAVGAELAMSADIERFCAGPLQFVGGTAWGFENGFNAEGYRVVAAPNANPMQSETFRATVAYVRERAPAGATFSRQHLLTNREWYESFDYQAIARVIGTDNMMTSIMQIGDERDEYTSMVLCRPAGAKAFDEREVSLVGLAMGEVARLLNGTLSRYTDPAPSKLSPRLRQVLQCLLEADSDKAIASRLGLSRHTVNQYTKQIYRYFGVNGRPELMSRWLSRGWSSRADWGAAAAALHLEHERSEPA